MGTESKGAHQWIIEFEQEPNSIEEFAKILDSALQQVNSDYEAKTVQEHYTRIINSGKS
ncbi:MAG: GH3 auxin-responsive promoter family protein [Marinilabiliales bacterium]|nr:GH3 auxin-responsive promoter family protein [Marinilabiliales bacterium]